MKKQVLAQLKKISDFCRCSVVKDTIEVNMANCQEAYKVFYWMRDNCTARDYIDFGHEGGCHIFYFGELVVCVEFTLRMF